jgi:hypothetical protein
VKGRLAAGAALLTVAAQAAVPGAAAADIGDMTCRGGKLTWTADPAITFNRLTISFTAHANLGLCISARYPQITGGTMDLRGAAKGGCPDGVGNGYGTATFTWNDGSTSTAQGAFTGNAGTLQVPVGRVTQGLFTGDTNTWTATTSKLDWYMCLTPWGIASAEAVVDTLVFYPHNAGDQSAPAS